MQHMVLSYTVLFICDNFILFLLTWWKEMSIATMLCCWMSNPRW